MRLVTVVLIAISSGVLANSNCACGADDHEQTGDDQSPIGAQQTKIDAAFEQMVFGGRGWEARAAARCRLRMSLRQKIAALDALCHLSALQKQKLELAGRGDIMRFFELVEALRATFHTVFRNEADVTDLTKLDPETTQRWSHLFDGHFESGSLFAKTRHSVLTEAQSAIVAAQVLADAAESARRDVSRERRRIKATVIVLEVDHRKLAAQGAILDRLFGRPSEGISIVDHDIPGDPELAALMQDGVLSVRGRPTVRTQDGGSCRFSWESMGAHARMHDVTGVTFQMSIVDDQVRMKTRAQIGHREPLRPNDILSLGAVEFAATVRFGQHVVFRGVALPVRNDENQKTTADDRERESPAGLDPDGALLRELVVIVTPELDDPTPRRDNSP